MAKRPKTSLAGDECTCSPMPWGPNVHMSADGSPYAIPGTPEFDADSNDDYRSPAAWSWRPGIGYLRRMLYATTTATEAKPCLVHIVKELRRLVAWASNMNIRHERAFEIQQAFEAFDDVACDYIHAAIIAAGVHVCRELEALQQAVRAAGYVCPHWNISNRELDAKRLHSIQTNDETQQHERPRQENVVPIEQAYLRHA